MERDWVWATPSGRKLALQLVMTCRMRAKDPAASRLEIGNRSCDGCTRHELLPLAIRANYIALELFLTAISTTDTANEFGQSRSTHHKSTITVPCTQPPVDGDCQAQSIAARSRTDMGAIVLCLVTNWSMNEETVLIDGRTLPKHSSWW